MRWHDVPLLIGLSVSCLVMIVAQSATIARFYAVRHQHNLTEILTSWDLAQPKEDFSR